MPFEPEGERALWRLALDVFQALPDGGMVSHVDLAEALGIQIGPSLESLAERRRLWSAVSEAGRYLVTHGGRRVTAIRGVGYRVDAPSDTQDQRILDSLGAALVDAVAAMINEAREEGRREGQQDSAR